MGQKNEFVCGTLWYCTLGLFIFIRRYIGKLEIGQALNGLGQLEGSIFICFSLLRVMRLPLVANRCSKEINKHLDRSHSQKLNIEFSSPHTSSYHLV